MNRETAPKRLRRAESFLGIHFDFHAGDDCTEIGKRTTPEMIEKIIQEVKPDYIQCDCKGHRQLSYTYADGAITIVLPRLEIHEIIVVE